VMPILEAISNSVFTLPAVASAGQVASGQSAARGGFASKFAAAQGLPISSDRLQAGGGEAQASRGPVVESAGPASPLNVRMLASGNPQLKRFLGSSVTQLSTGADGNVVVPGFTSVMASQISSPPPQPSLLTALTTVARAQGADVTGGRVQAGSQITAYNATVQSTGSGARSQTAGIGGPFSSSDETGGKLTNPSTAAVSVANVIGQADQLGHAMVNGAQSLSLSTVATGPASGAALRNEAGGQTNGSQNGLASTAPNTQPRVSTATTQPQPMSGDILQETTPSREWDSHGSGKGAAEPVLLAESMQPGPPSTTAAEPVPVNLSSDGVRNSAGSVSPLSGSVLGSVGPTFHPDQAIVSTATAPTLLVSTSPKAEPWAGVPASPDLQTGQANTANVIAAETAVQTDISTKTGTGNPVSGMINTNSQIAASSIVSPAVQLEPGKAPEIGAAPGVAEVVTAPNVRGAGQGAGSPASILNSAASAGPNSASGSLLSKQTPFSIFFSGPGPGTEAAASTLPKMILPAIGATIRDSHATGNDAPSTSPQTSSLQSGVTHSGTPQNSKESSARAENGSLPAGQPLRRDGDGNVANPQFAAAHLAAAPAPVAPIAVVTLPLGGPATLAADSPPKTGTFSPSANGGAANVTPAVPERPVVVPGPVLVAQLINRVEQSEMRIGMHTSAFGNVEVRTVVHANDVGLMIGSEKGDLRGLLSNDMTGIAKTLQEQNLRLNSVNFTQGFASSNNGAGGGDSQQRPFVPMRAGSGSALSEASVNDSGESLSTRELAASRNSLSILA
jgi:hypothetical protein